MSYEPMMLNDQLLPGAMTCRDAFLPKPGIYRRGPWPIHLASSPSTTVWPPYEVQRGELSGQLLESARDDGDETPELTSH